MGAIKKQMKTTKAQKKEKTSRWEQLRIQINKQKHNE